jgi:hypothetical protein
VGRQLEKFKREEPTNWDIMMGSQSTIDKSMGGGTTLIRTLGSSVPQRGGGAKNHPNNDTHLLELQRIRQ